MSRLMEDVHPGPSRRARWIIVGVIGLLFLVPIAAMIEFTLRKGLGGGYDFSRWAAVFGGGLGNEYKPIFTGLGNSLLLAVVTVVVMLVLLVPTMVLVRIRFPKLQRVLEFVCLIPITIPAIVLVVGLAPVYSVIARMFGSGVWTLAFAYGVIVLPYAFRSIQTNLVAVDVVTLSEAARSLGAGWLTILFRVVVPNIRRGLLAASFISVAVVLGEFTIAALLNRVNLQTALVVVNKADPFVAVIFALLALVFAFVLLIAIGRIGGTPSGGGRRGRRGRRPLPTPSEKAVA
ncbi:ABC transporter permease [Herbiconiux ginsengi]|uniref:Putative spermidine/putrescine transport system permease protein n=1 Tax=Herbiconiux ginsengi TaxID=381665 RepID=A0A1H3SC01_9MICO|nr:ABC transporter permease subunit [Herbiconiux ginsengi]SDZ35546.1 putative spermidine/putrescine transport system permease protein [Herbiconiux ginsengi]